MNETEPVPQRGQQPSAALSSPLVRRFGLWAFGLLSSGLLRLLGATWRVEVLGHDPRRAGTGAGAQLAALFHESLLPSAWIFRDRRYSVAVSRSRDGDLIRATLLGLGYAEPIRGSSSRGGSAALRGLVRHLKDGVTIAVLVDGPRGPARVAKSGIVTLSRITGQPIQPVAFSARPAIRLKSWDRSLIPLPFARVVCAYGEALSTDARSPADDAVEQAAARRLDEALTALHHEADGYLLGR
jgi:lysophospholipid acyltransferase (LPLAT)-like uncharacterized protein